jgi:hypothetical protein
MIYGLWNGTWYGFVLTAIFTTFGVILWSAIRRARYISDLELERIARAIQEHEDGELQAKSSQRLSMPRSCRPGIGIAVAIGEYQLLN